VKADFTDIDGQPGKRGPWAAGTGTPQGWVIESTATGWMPGFMSSGCRAVAVDATAVWMGDYGKVTRLELASSKTISSMLPAPYSLVKTLLVADQELWVGLEGGKVFTRELGATYTWKQRTDRPSLHSMWNGLSPAFVWGSGGDRVDRLRADGAWEIVIPGSGRTFQGLWSNGNDVFACASGGNLFRCRNGQSPCRRIDLADTPSYQALHLAPGKRWMAGTGGTLCVDEGWGCEQLSDAQLLGSRSLRSVWAPEIVQVGSEAWAVGDGATIVHVGTSGGISQEAVTGIAPATLHSLAGKGSGPSWAGGDGGIWQRDATTQTWSNTLQLSGTVRAVWASSVTTAWAAASGGAVHHLSGGKWVATNPVPGNDDILYAIHGSSDTDVWAVGENGRVLHYAKGSWQTVATPCQGNLRGVYVSPTAKVWIVGAVGQICHFDGTSWTKQQSGVTTDLLAIRGTSDTEIWVAGADGTVLHFDDRLAP
jgi:hypothetical protein